MTLTPNIFEGFGHGPWQLRSFYYQTSAIFPYLLLAPSYFKGRATCIRCDGLDGGRPLVLNRFLEHRQPRNAQRLNAATVACS